MSDLLTRSEISDMMCDIYAMGTYDAFAIRNGYFEKSMDYVVRSTGVIYKILATFDALMERNKALETHAQEQEMALAFTWSLVLSHEEHIDKLNARIDELKERLLHE